uniref:Vacuolar protein sorting-associated protein 13 DH-like domain-containing protein n=1 Tax=Panagrolaimus sp. ES5 TaxID=591445 RepID=A0AC34GEE1_9BILA
MYNKDLELARPHFSEMVATTQATQQKAFDDDLHISPLMIHLSFSQGGTAADLSTGFGDLFYQHINGAIQGLKEFAEGLCVYSLFGHAVGCAAGAVSRITGTLGKGVAALIFDEEY